MVDFNRAYVLLSVIKETLGHPQLRGLHNEALKELGEIQAELTPEPEPAPEPESISDDDEETE